MKPSFALLKSNYPRRSDVPTEALQKLLGWDDLIGNAYWANSCAVRVSLALVRSNVPIPGRMTIKAGPHKGKHIEPGQAKLARILARPSMLGTPEKFARGQAEKGVGNRQGIVAFFKIHPEEGNNQGHIDLVSVWTGGLRGCGTECYWDSKEVWFWELQ